MKQLFVASSLQQGKILLCPMDLNFDPENWDCTDDGTVSHMWHVLAKFLSNSRQNRRNIFLRKVAVDSSCFQQILQQTSPAKLERLSAEWQYWG